MALFNQAPRKVQLPYIFTKAEEAALKLLPEGLVKSTEHDTLLLDKLIDEERRDMEWENLVNDCFEALRDGDKIKLLVATQNATVEQRQEVVQQYFFLLSKMYTTKDEAKIRELAKKDKSSLQEVPKQSKTDVIISQIKGKVKVSNSEPKPIVIEYDFPIIKDGVIIKVEKRKIERQSMLPRQVNQYNILKEDLNKDIFSLCLVGSKICK